jgi:hypothetical protein
MGPNDVRPCGGRSPLHLGSGRPLCGDRFNYQFLQHFLVHVGEIFDVKAALAGGVFPQIGEQRYALLGECADHDVVAIWIPERKLFCSCGGVHVRLLVESGYKSAGPMECQIEIIDTEKQE